MDIANDEGKNLRRGKTHGKRRCLLKFNQKILGRYTTQKLRFLNKTQVSSQDVVLLCLCVLISQKCYKKVSPFCTGLSIYNTYMRINSSSLSHNSLGYIPRVLITNMHRGTMFVRSGIIGDLRLNETQFHYIRLV